MPHLLDGDDFIPGGMGGLDDGDRVTLPWVRRSVTAADFAAAPVRGWWSDDLYLRRPRQVREVRGELIVLTARGFFMAVRPAAVYPLRPDEKKSYTDPSPPSLADSGRPLG